MGAKFYATSFVALAAPAGPAVRAAVRIASAESEVRRLLAGSAGAQG
jgi:hypothetical protein